MSDHRPGNRRPARGRRESLQNGTYKINPDAIASRMLEQLDQQLHG